MRAPAPVVLCAVAAAFLFADRVAAQSPDRSGMVGVVFDASGAVLANASVSVSGPALIGGVRSTQSAADGTYRFPALPPGLYDVVAEAQGFRPTRVGGIRLYPGSTQTADLRLEIGSVSEVLDVSGGAPVVDVTAAAIPTNVGQEMLADLPAVRWLPSVINLTPGVAGDVAYGGSQGSNGMFVDGVDITSPQLQQAWGRMNYNWVQDVQVVGLGASAEHGGFTGASARSVLRSGSNRVSGLAEYWTTQPNWLADNTRGLDAALRRAFEAKRLLERWDVNAHVGGPLMKDRLWFFVGAQRVTDDSRPAGYSWTGSRREEDPRLIAKATAAPSAVLRLEGFVQRGVYTVTGEGIDPYTPIEAAWDLRQPQTAWAARATWTPGPRTLVEAGGGGLSLTHTLDPHAPGTRSGPAPHYDLATGLYSTNVSTWLEQVGSRQSATVALTHFADDFLGRTHALKFGVEYERSRSEDRWGTPGGTYYLDDGGAPYLAFLSKPKISTSRTPRLTAYVQDDWRVTGRVTLSPGIRISANRGDVPGGRVFSTTPVSPRLGVAWDIGANHRTVLRAHYGRYHDPTFSSRITEDDMSGQSSESLVLVLAPGEFFELESYPPVDNFAVDAAIRHSYMDQAVVGIERQLGRSLSLQAHYIRRNYEDFMGVVDTGSAWVPVTTSDSGPDAVPGNADDGAALTVFRRTNPGQERYLYTNPPDANRRYDGVQLIGRRRNAGRWQAQASYTWSRTTGTVTNHWHVNAARYDLGNPGTFVNPNARLNADGRAPFDFTHEVKLLGSYRLPVWGGFLLSGVYRMHSGYAWGRNARITVRDAGTLFVRVEPRGSRRTPALNALDIRVGLDPIWWTSSERRIGCPQ